MNIKKEIEELEREIISRKGRNGETYVYIENKAKIKTLKIIHEKLEELKERTNAMFWISEYEKRKFIVEINDLFYSEVY